LTDYYEFEKKKKGKRANLMVSRGASIAFVIAPARAPLKNSRASLEPRKF